MAPNTWMARLTTRVCSRAATTLIADTSTRALRARATPRLVEPPGGPQHQQARLIDLQARLGNPFLHVGKVGQVLAEGLALQRAFAHQRQRQLTLANGAHAVVDAPRPQARLRHGKARALLAQQVRWPARARCEKMISQCPSGDWCCMIGMLRTTVTPGVSMGTSTMLCWACLVGFVIAAAAHHDQQLAVGMGRAGDEPLAAVEHQLGRRLVQHASAGWSGRRRPHRARTWQRPSGFRRRAGGAATARSCAGVANRCSSSMLPVSGALQLNTSGAPGQAPHDLGQRRVLQVAQALARARLAQAGQEQVPQALRLGQGLEVIHERRRVNTLRHRLVPGGVVGQHVAVMKASSRWRKACTSGG